MDLHTQIMSVINIYIYFKGHSERQREKYIHRYLPSSGSFPKLPQQQADGAGESQEPGITIALGSPTWMA